MSLTDELKNFAEKVGLDIVRVTSAEPFLEAAERIKQQIRKGFRPKWKIEEIDAYCNPKSVLSDAKSIVVAAECYLTSEPVNFSKPSEPHGGIARYTWRNYYYDVKMKLKILADFLEKKVDGFRFRCYSNGPLAEKPMAQRAGIGWYGKHGIIVTKQYGSWIVLGELICNVELEEDEPIDDSCGSCEACIKACPTGAIVEPYTLDMPKCLQYITHRQMVMPNHIRELWGERLYGCTECQEVCPINRKVKPKDRKPDYGYVGPSLPLIKILQMNESEYRRCFNKNQIGEWWVSFGAIKRNAAVALGNIGDPIAVPALIHVLKKSRSTIVKMHASWALGKIGDHNAKLALKNALKMKLEPQVQKEVKNALKAVKP
jgi:epoxyqueuosine reductase